MDRNGSTGSSLECHNSYELGGSPPNTPTFPIAYPDHQRNERMPLFPSEYEQHQYWMQRAIALAQQAGDAGEIPVGALIIDDRGQCLSEAENQRERHNDPTAHAEILALRQAGVSRQNWHLNHCTLYVTLEPCPMCAGAILQARIQCLVYGADDPKTGSVRTVLNLPDHQVSFHRLKVRGGICEAACQQQLKQWFQAHRHIQNSDPRT